MYNLGGQCTGIQKPKNGGIPPPNSKNAYTQKKPSSQRNDSGPLGTWAVSLDHLGLSAVVRYAVCVFAFRADVRMRIRRLAGAAGAQLSGHLGVGVLGQSQLSGLAQASRLLGDLALVQKLRSAATEPALKLPG